MVCKNCSTNYDDSMSYCPACGAPAYTAEQNNNQYGYQYGNSFNGQYAQQNVQSEPYTMPHYSVPEFKPAITEKPASVGQYVGWTLLAYALGPISLIISIIFAVMPEKKNRANFFRAQLVIWAILIVLFIIAVIAVTVFGFSLLASSGIVDEFAYYLY